jgi:hypothetical protein
MDQRLLGFYCMELEYDYNVTLGKIERHPTEGFIGGVFIPKPVYLEIQIPLTALMTAWSEQDAQSAIESMHTMVEPLVTSGQISPSNLESLDAYFRDVKGSHSSRPW